MQTSPLKNGDKVPDYPDHTTALRVKHYGNVYDDADGHQLTAGLHRNELAMLQGGQQGGLGHLYRYAIIAGTIYHTRSLVTVEVECTDAETES